MLKAMAAPDARTTHVREGSGSYHSRTASGTQGMAAFSIPPGMPDDSPSRQRPGDLPLSLSPEPRGDRRVIVNEDILLSTTLMTTYLMVVRTWRRIFEHLYCTLSGTDSSKPNLARLPDLQIQVQGFDVQSNPALQIALLHQDITARLRMIEASLGIFSGSASGLLIQDGHEDIRVAMSRMLITDPLAIALQQTLLAREKQHGSACQGLAHLTLSELMDKVKRIVIMLGLV